MHPPPKWGISTSGIIIAVALRPGYVLVGARQAVFVREDGQPGDVQPVPAYEAAVVTQLLAEGHLRIGGERQVRWGERRGSAQSVLVSAESRRRLARHDFYRNY